MIIDSIAQATWAYARSLIALLCPSCRLTICDPPRKEFQRIAEKAVGLNTRPPHRPSLLAERHRHCCRRLARVAGGISRAIDDRIASPESRSCAFGPQQERRIRRAKAGTLHVGYRRAVGPRVRGLVAR